MSSAAATVFTLFIVTYGADVKHSNYESLAQCEDAKSIALYGRTVTQKKADDAAEEKYRNEQQAKWEKAHPPRPPKDDSEREMIKQKGVFLWSGCGAICTGGHVTKDGLIQDDPPSGGAMISGMSSANDIKTAECVVRP